MSLQGVVKKDILDVRRAKLIWGVGLLYTLFTVLFFYGTGSTSENAGELSSQLFSMAGIAVLVIPLVALVAAYLSVAGERESGSLKFLLSYPNNRLDVVLGKLVARSAVVGASVLFAFVVGLGLGFYYFDSVDLGTYFGFVGLTLLFALVYVSIAVGISAATSSRSRAMGAAIGTWFVLNVFWNSFPVTPSDIINFVADKLGLDISESVLHLITALSPSYAYFVALDFVFEVNPATGKGMVDRPHLTDWFLEPWFMLVILAFWAVVPLALGYWRFERADLG
ncbi:ABC transporter permease [Haloarchaeobius sp. HME9146]|uniref:ABC transporter permease n=1 Tax=Haloarchaeobius sp. HME9146 TaxID=2978732 RepID=UPI0021C07BDF|nr:ABC transporter permease [Haloarchaeobius sp. HME9146]MCT9096768.1 ABC transporter permease [Haloarchaeobius sp. HME9146]